jgi:outer membrane protein assembly factor BamE (lipoprotein component of BamABCDE complex)
MREINKYSFVLVLLILSLSSIASNLTLGLVKSQIKVGTSQAEVIGILGSPNMVTSDRSGNEVWTYDKVSSTTIVDGNTQTDIDSEGSSFGLGAVGLPFLGGIGFSDKKEKTNNNYQSNVTVSKKTLTVIIKFDDKSLVSQVKTHMSKF